MNVTVEDLKTIIGELTIQNFAKDRLIAQLTEELNRVKTGSHNPNAINAPNYPQAPLAQNVRAVTKE